MVTWYGYCTVMFLVKLTNGTSRRCHIDQLRRREMWKEMNSQDVNENEIEFVKDNESVEDNESVKDDLMESFQVFTQSNNPPMEVTHPSSSNQRYPSRQRSSPVRFSDLYI